MIGDRGISTAIAKEQVHTFFVHKSRLFYKHRLVRIWAAAIRIGRSAGIRLGALQAAGGGKTNYL
jgi:hypothetical protein